MSRSVKRHVRERLKNAERNLDILDACLMKPRVADLAPYEKYTFFSKRLAKRVPLQFMPKYTKLEAPKETPYGYK